MSVMEADELREMSVDALTDQLSDLSRQLMGYRLQKGGAHLTKTHLLKATKRDIARIKTVIAEKNRQQSAESDPVQKIKGTKKSKGDKEE